MFFRHLKQISGTRRGTNKLTLCVLFCQSNYFFFSLHATFHFLPQVHLQPNFSAPLTVASETRREEHLSATGRSVGSIPHTCARRGDGLRFAQENLLPHQLLPSRGRSNMEPRRTVASTFTSASNWTVTFGNFQKTPPWSLVCACTNTNSKLRQTKTFSVSPKGILNTHLKAYNVLNIPTQVSKLDVLQPKHSNLKLRRPIEY